MEQIKKKLTSRKFLLAVAGVIVGLATVLGVDGGDITTVAGAVVSLVSAVAYIVTEGRIDAAAVGNAAGAVQDAIDAINGADGKTVKPTTAQPPASTAAALAAITAANVKAQSGGKS